MAIYIDELKSMKESETWLKSDLFLVKDTNSKYLYGNENTVNSLGLKSFDNFVGKTDYDILCPAVEIAESYVSEDKKCMQSKADLLTLDVTIYADGNPTIVLARRQPLIDKTNKVIGVHTTGIFRTYHNNNEDSRLLIKLGFNLVHNLRSFFL